MTSLEFLSKKLDVRIDLLQSARREKPLVSKKRIAIWFYRLNGLSVLQIGVKLAQHHTTVGYSLQKVSEEEKAQGEALFKEWLQLNGVIEKDKVIVKRKIPDYKHSEVLEVEEEI